MNQSLQQKMCEYKIVIVIILCVLISAQAWPYEIQFVQESQNDSKNKSCNTRTAIVFTNSQQQFPKNSDFLKISTIEEDDEIGYNAQSDIIVDIDGGKCANKTNQNSSQNIYQDSKEIKKQDNDDDYNNIWDKYPQLTDDDDREYDSINNNSEYQYLSSQVAPTPPSPKFAAVEEDEQVKHSAFKVIGNDDRQFAKETNQISLQNLSQISNETYFQGDDDDDDNNDDNILISIPLQLDVMIDHDDRISVSLTIKKNNNKNNNVSSQVAPTTPQNEECERTKSAACDLIGDDDHKFATENVQNSSQNIKNQNNNNKIDDQNVLINIPLNQVAIIDDDDRIKASLNFINNTKNVSPQVHLTPSPSELLPLYSRYIIDENQQNDYKSPYANYQQQQSYYNTQQNNSELTQNEPNVEQNIDHYANKDIIVNDNRQNARIMGDDNRTTADQNMYNNSENKVEVVLTPPPIQYLPYYSHLNIDNTTYNNDDENQQYQENEDKYQFEIESQFNDTLKLDTELKLKQPFIFQVLSEQKLTAILPRQITPSKEDINACTTYWEDQQQSPPQGYNSSLITHCYPLSAVGRLQIFFEGIPEPVTCSGAMIGPHTVLTAAHCFLRETTNIEFTPGQFGDYKPFGSFQNGIVHLPDDFNWISGANDYAVVNFEEDIGALTGWLGVEYEGCDDVEKIRGYDLMLAGFADDKGDKMWTAECSDTIVNQCANGDESGIFHHVCDTNGGTSGAPLMENYFIYGVHSGYVNLVDRNAATYISRKLMDFIQQYIQ